MGYYRWVIGTNNKILAQQNGDVAGNHWLIKSLRTENIGILSLPTYLWRFCEFYEVQIVNDKTIHYWNNKIKVNRIKYIQKGNKIKPNQVLKADYNVQAQIEHMIYTFKQKQQWPWSTEHVKDHQIRNELTREAELNNVFDSLVTQAKE